MKVLLLDGQTRQVLPMALSLRKLGHDVAVLCPNKLCLGYVSRWPNHRIIGPDAELNPQGFIDALRNILRKEHYDVVIPLFDYSAHITSQNKDELSKHTKIATNDYAVFMKARDKYQTMQVCMKNDIPCPCTYAPEGQIGNDVLNAMRYPAAIKPTRAHGARGFCCANNQAELIAAYASVTKDHGSTLIQEYIPQTDLQYKCELFVASDGAVKAAVVFSKVRWYPIKGGSSTFNITVHRPDIVETCIRLLRAIGWRGYADVDLIQDPRDGIAKVMEINPRITGSVKIAFSAGVDFAKMIVDDLMGKKIDPVDYKKGIGLRLLHKDLLWLIKSPNRFKTKPSWFSFANTTDQIISVSDPLPGICFSFEWLIKLTGRHHRRPTGSF